MTTFEAHSLIIVLKNVGAGFYPGPVAHREEIVRDGDRTLRYFGRQWGHEVAIRRLPPIYLRDSEIATCLFIRTDNRQPLTVNRKSRFLTAFEMTGRAVEMTGND